MELKVKKEKDQSAGIIFIKHNLGEEYIFMGRATNSKPSRWDIPKGHIEEGETPIQAAVRECQEETGFVVNPYDLSYIGKFNFSSNKDLHIFISSGYPPKVETPTCSSMFTMYGKTFPEMDAYKWVRMSKIDTHAGKSLAKVIKAIFGN